MILSSFSMANFFGVMDVPYSVGAGYYDENNYLRLSDRNLGFSYRNVITENVEPFFSVSMKLKDPIANNDLQLGLRLKYDNLNLGIGLWNSFTDPSTDVASSGIFSGIDWSYTEDNSEYSGYFGTNFFVDGSFGNIIYGLPQEKPENYIVNDTSGLKYYFQAFPEDLGVLRGFSGYLGYKIVDNDEMTLKFFLNLPARYSIVPGGLVFFNLNSNYTFTVYAELK